MGKTWNMNERHDHRLALASGEGPRDLGREALASLALILITIALVLTTSFVGFAVS
jgi:hypothetical protein